MRALALLTFISTLPAAALAQAEAPPERWSLGGGISTLVYVSNPIPGSALVVGSPVAVASLERRVGDTTWLVLGFSGAISDSRQDAASSDEEDLTVRQRSLVLDVGVRRVVSGPGLPVEVSFLALAEGGYGERSGTLLTDGDLDSSEWTAGGSVGLALDRELTRGLAVRVATPVAGVWWSRSRQQPDGGEARDARSWSARAYLAPRIELRLAF